MTSHQGTYPTDKPLDLTEDEILRLYNIAQREAETEADWRGVHWQGGSSSTGNRETSLLSRTTGKSEMYTDFDYGGSFLRVMSRALESTALTTDSFSKGCRWPW